ncbi:MAG: hypothetical protein WC810_26455 [Janthinobacterium sp.]|jgi:hypothetical protein
MTQLNLFDNNEPDEAPNLFILPNHHKSDGCGNIDVFLQLGRTEFNQFIHTGDRINDLCYEDDIDTLKHILFKFDADMQEWVHKPILNFRINQLLHNQYDYLNEKYNV